MDALRLLPAPLEPPSTVEAYSRSTSLVPVTRLPLAAHSNAQDGSAYPSDQVVWTVSVGDDGSFNFYAMPRQGSRSKASAGQDFLSGEGSNPAWGIPQVQIGDAVTQYAFYAALSAPATGQYLNVYA